MPPFKIAILALYTVISVYALAVTAWGREVDWLVGFEVGHLLYYTGCFGVSKFILKS